MAAFIADQANTGLRASTLGRRVAAIAYAHGFAGLEPPTNSKAVRVVLDGARRKIGIRPTQKAPATAERITAMPHSLRTNTQAAATIAPTKCFNGRMQSER